MGRLGRRARAVFFGTAALLTHACTPRGAELPPEAQAALRGLDVRRGTPTTSLFRWQLPEGCRLEYAARVEGGQVRFSMTGGKSLRPLERYLKLEYPTRLVPAGGPSSMTLEIGGDNGRHFFVPRVISEPVYKDGQLIEKGLSSERVHLRDEEPTPWGRIGSRPGLRVFFPDLPQAPEWKTVEGWFTIRGQSAALFSAQSDAGLQGTYLVLASGRRLWAKVIAYGRSDDFVEAKLVSACDGPTLNL